MNKDLRGAARDRVRRDCRVEHFHVPVSRRSWIFANDVDKIESECGIAHRFLPHPWLESSDHSFAVGQHRYSGSVGTQAVRTLTGTIPNPDSASNSL
jgi:hypothetical protein